MKKISILCIITICLFACKSKTTQVSLEGEMKGLTNDTLYLYGTDGLYNRTDTLYAKDGKFSGKIKVDTLSSAMLLFNGNQEYPIFMDKGNRIEIKGNAADFLKVNGNTTNDELTVFQQELKGLGKPSEKALQEKAEIFIRQHPSSFASVYLLNKYFAQLATPDFTKIKELTQLMAGRLLDAPSVEKVSDYIDQWEKVKDGKPAPYFSLPNVKGDKISRTSEKLKNKYLLIHFWASWNDTLPEGKAALRKLNRTYKSNKNFTILGISLDIDKEEWEKSIKNDTLSWEQVCDFTGWSSETAKQFAIQTIPTNILVSPTGTIVARDIQGDSLTLKLKEVLKADEEAKKKKTSH